MVTARSAGALSLRSRLRPRWLRWLSRRIPPASSVRLDQRRIFIIPSAAGAVFSLVLLLLLLVGINYQNSLAYGLTFFLMAVFIVAILHTFRNLAGLTVQAAGSMPVFVGEQALFKVRLLSTDRAHQAIALGWPATGLQLCDVPQNGAAPCALSQPALRRGWLKPERLRVESRFPLGLLLAWSMVDSDQAVLVYPRPLPGELPLSAGLGDEDEDQGSRTLGQGADDFQGLKTYQPGDSRRRLHWKAYSRGQGLLVKDFAALAGQDVWLDLLALGGDTEARLSVLCHWVLKLHERGQPFGLRLPGTQVSIDTGERHRDACLQALALYGVRP